MDSENVDTTQQVTSKVLETLDTAQQVTSKVPETQQGISKVKVDDFWRVLITGLSISLLSDKATRRAKY